MTTNTGYSTSTDHLARYSTTLHATTGDYRVCHNCFREYYDISTPMGQVAGTLENTKSRNGTTRASYQSPDGRILKPNNSTVLFTYACSTANCIYPALPSESLCYSCRNRLYCKSCRPKRAKQAPRKRGCLSRLFCFGGR